MAPAGVQDPHMRRPRLEAAQRSAAWRMPFGGATADAATLGGIHSEWHGKLRLAFARQGNIAALMPVLRFWIRSRPPIANRCRCRSLSSKQRVRVASVLPAMPLGRPEGSVVTTFTGSEAFEQLLSAASIDLPAARSAARKK